MAVNGDSTSDVVKRVEPFLLKRKKSLALSTMDEGAVRLCVVYPNR